MIGLALSLLPLWIIVGLIVEARTNPFQHPEPIVWLLWPILVVDVVYSRFTP